MRRLWRDGEVETTERPAENDCVAERSVAYGSEYLYRRGGEHFILAQSIWAGFTGRIPDDAWRLASADDVESTSWKWYEATS